MREELFPADPRQVPRERLRSLVIRLSCYVVPPLKRCECDRTLRPEGYLRFASPFIPFLFGFSYIKAIWWTIFLPPRVPHSGFWPGASARTLTSRRSLLAGPHTFRDSHRSCASDPGPEALPSRHQVQRTVSLRTGPSARSTRRNRSLSRVQATARASLWRSFRSSITKLQSRF